MSHTKYFSSESFVKPYFGGIICRFNQSEQLHSVNEIFSTPYRIFQQERP